VELRWASAYVKERSTCSSSKQKYPTETMEPEVSKPFNNNTTDTRVVNGYKRRLCMVTPGILSRSTNRMLKPPSKLDQRQNSQLDELTNKLRRWEENNTMKMSWRRFYKPKRQTSTASRPTIISRICCSTRWGRQTPWLTKYGNFREQNTVLNIVGDNDWLEHHGPSFYHSYRRARK